MGKGNRTAASTAARTRRRPDSAEMGRATPRNENCRRKLKVLGRPCLTPLLAKILGKRSSHIVLNYRGHNHIKTTVDVPANQRQDPASQINIFFGPKGPQKVRFFSKCSVEIMKIFLL